MCAIVLSLNLAKREVSSLLRWSLLVKVDKSESFVKVDGVFISKYSGLDSYETHCISSSQRKLAFGVGVTVVF